MQYKSPRTWSEGSAELGCRAKRSRPHLNNGRVAVWFCLGSSHPLRRIESIQAHVLKSPGGPVRYRSGVYDVRNAYQCLGGVKVVRQRGIEPRTPELQSGALPSELLSQSTRGRNRTHAVRFWRPTRHHDCPVCMWDVMESNHRG